MSHLTLRRALYSEQDTRDLAASLARLARPGDVIALEGDLGAGKTVFARAFVTALGCQTSKSWEGRRRRPFA